MVKPILNNGRNITAFDSSKDSIRVPFQFSGQNVTTAHLYIYAPTDNSLIATISSSDQLGKGILIPAGQIPLITSSTGYKYYYARLAVEWDGGQSSKSSPVLMYCYEEPTFVFDDEYIYSNKLISTSSCIVGITYSQSAGEALKHFNIKMYNKNRVLLEETPDILYSKTQTYNFTGLVGDEIYYFTAEGETEYGTKLYIDYTPVKVKYIVPSSGVSVIATPMDCEGQIKIQVCVNANRYEYENGTPTYDDNTWINLENNGVLYANSGGLESNNTVMVKLKNPQDGSLILKLTDLDDSDVGELYYYEFEQTKYESLSYWHANNPSVLRYAENPFTGVEELHMYTYNMEHFENGVERDELYELIKENDPEYRYPVPTDDHVTKRYGYFVYKYGTNSIFSDYYDLGMDDEFEGVVAIRQKDGYCELVTRRIS